MRESKPRRILIASRPPSCTEWRLGFVVGLISRFVMVFADWAKSVASVGSDVVLGENATSVSIRLCRTGQSPQLRTSAWCDELFHKCSRRLILNFTRGSDLLDSGVVHHGHSIGHFERFFLVMGDKEGGDF